MTELKLSPYQMKQIREQIAINKILQRAKDVTKLKWDSNSIAIIKEQIVARKKLGLKNDWKIPFLQSKLPMKDKAITKLKRLLK